MKVLLVATHEERYFSTLIRSLQARKIHYFVLGKNEKWDGYMMKLKLIFEWLENQNPREIVMYLDAFDSLVVGNVLEAEEVFKSTGHDILLSSGEPQMGTLGKYVAWKVFGTPFGERHISAGMFMGYAGPLRKYLKELINICKGKTNDDERCINSNRQLLQKYKAGIDLDDRIFHNLNSVLIGTEKYDPKTVQKTAFAISAPGGQVIHESWHPLVKAKVDKCTSCRLLRRVRIIPDYGMYFIPEIIAIVFLIFCIRWYAV